MWRAAAAIGSSAHTRQRRAGDKRGGAAAADGIRQGKRQLGLGPLDADRPCAVSRILGVFRLVVPTIIGPRQNTT